MQITTALEASHRDADAIASGVDSWALMFAAGRAAAQFAADVARRIGTRGITVVAGSGNNGGDAYVVAAELLRRGFELHLVAVGEPRSADAIRARDLYNAARNVAGPRLDVEIGTTEQLMLLVVDGLLGTGQQGALREQVREQTRRINTRRDSGAAVVIALDVPTGVNATTGEIVNDAVRADYTLSFGTMKRAHVLQREQCGEVIVFDIGLGEFASKDDGAWTLADTAMLRARVPNISWEAHKGTRGRVAIVGGAHGMAGAVVLAAQAALRSGAGLVFAYVAAESVLPVQINVAQAMAHALLKATLREQLDGAHTLVVGPGFGRGAQSRELLDVLLATLVNAMPNIPLVLDADALTLIGTDINRLKLLTQTREDVCTPHVGEFARLIGQPAAVTLENRVEQAQELVAQTGCTILLKGTPTIVVSPNTGSTIIVPRGTPVLATGGSGDMLSGMVGTLLAQSANAADAAAIAAWVHGRAAELATELAQSVRGVTLQDVMNAMPNAWAELAPSLLQSHAPRAAAVDSAGSSGSGVLAHLPRVWSDSNS